MTVRNKPNPSDLSKRELFAAVAMHALLGQGLVHNFENISALAVMQADLLINTLDDPVNGVERSE